jgi:hypothetical protein
MPGDVLGFVRCKTITLEVAADGIVLVLLQMTVYSWLLMMNGIYLDLRIVASLIFRVSNAFPV